MSNMIVFYHPNSEACNKFKNIIPKDTQVKFINIQTLQNIPSGVKSVPCLIVDDKNVYTGKDAFNYFSSKNELECISLCSKNSKCSFSTLTDDSVESNCEFSCIDQDSMSKGIPKYEEKSNNQMNLDEFAKQRATEFSPISRE